MILLYKKRGIRIGQLHLRFSARSLITTIMVIGVAHGRRGEADAESNFSRDGVAEGTAIRSSRRRSCRRSRTRYSTCISWPSCVLSPCGQKGGGALHFSTKAHELPICNLLSLQCSTTVRGEACAPTAAVQLRALPPSLCLVCFISSLFYDTTAPARVQQYH